MNTIILKNDNPGKKELAVPVPDGWLLERTLEVLREVGHEPVRILDEMGGEVPIPKEKAA